jgi:hypothetical protein
VAEHRQRGGSETDGQPRGVGAAAHLWGGEIERYLQQANPTSSFCETDSFWIK